MSATHQVLNAPELLEHMLLHLPLRSLLLARRVNNKFAAVMKGSVMVNKVLWLQPASDSTAAWDPKRSHDGNLNVNTELGVWRMVGAEPQATVTPILNPFLTIKRSPCDFDDDGSNFCGYDKIGMHLEADNVRHLTLTNDGTYQTRLDMTYVYPAAITVGTGIEGMLVTQPSCTTVRLLHRSADPQEDCRNFWDRHGLRKTEVDIDGAGGLTVGRLLAEMEAGAPSIDDQDEYDRHMQEKANNRSKPESGGLVDGLKGPSNYILNMASMASLFANMNPGLFGGNGDAGQGSETREEASGVEENEAKDAGQTLDDGGRISETEEPKSETVGEELGTAKAAAAHSESANESNEKNGEDDGAEKCDQVPTYTAEYSIVGGTEFRILKGTVDTITGWEMLEVFDMGIAELDQLERIQQAHR